MRDTVGLHDLRLHDLRHSAATFAFAAGASVREVADLLGHADGGALVLGRYGHVLDQRRHENAAAINGVFSPDPNVWLPQPPVGPPALTDQPETSADLRFQWRPRHDSNMRRTV
ncbi:tyrosine-type recombinase/integrase [Euzebya pacifica]|uniref:tyrosine-type recombinase/integrase n=1 Tax=Euzebya pacifica TaxID=1608957 RepID=UPI003C6D7567